jgi:phage host-nuclease inhibitor protein Gam
MSELTDKLRGAGEQHKGTDLGGLLQWAALHIADQDEALAELREEHAEEERERIRLERAMFDAKGAIEAALTAISAPMCPPIELGRDFVPHINLMAGHGDPDYLKANGNSIRHVDCRTTKHRAKKPSRQVQQPPHQLD